MKNSTALTLSMAGRSKMDIDLSLDRVIREIHHMIFKIRHRKVDDIEYDLGKIDDLQKRKNVSKHPEIYDAAIQALKKYVKRKSSDLNENDPNS